MAKFRSKSKPLPTFKPKPRKVPVGHHQLTIVSLADDGRGIARADGKTVFVTGALPGEVVSARYKGSYKNYDVADTVQIIQPAAERVQPVCEYFLSCGGCSLQHLAYTDQLTHKKHHLQMLFKPLLQDNSVWAETLAASALQYRHRARFAVSADRDGCVVGFKQAESHKVVDIDRCYIVQEAISNSLLSLKPVIGALKSRSSITEVSITEDSDKKLAVLMLCKHQPEASDITVLQSLADAKNWLIELRLVNTHTSFWRSGDKRLVSLLSDAGISLPYALGDFTQVNEAVNQQLISTAISWLAVNKEDVVADYFCGIGNFSLPVAQRAGSVLGYELNKSMVEKAEHSAVSNNIENTRFFCRNLMSDNVIVEAVCNKVLLDPPRAGAEQLCEKLAASEVTDIVYISCNPSTLRRDAAILLAGGFTLSYIALADMFPQTKHSEVITLFTKNKG